MSTKHFTPLFGRRVRITELSDCGALEDGARTMTTDGFITVSLSTEIEDGNEVLVRRADGSICVNEKSSDSFKYFNMEMQVCGVNPSFLSMISNAEEYEDWNSDVAGITIAEGEINKRLAFELWTGVTGETCSTDGDSTYGYILLPHLRGGVLGDLEVNGEDSIDFTVTGMITVGGNMWGTGPYDVLLKPGAGEEDPKEPARLPEALKSIDHFLLVETNLAPPASSEEPSTLVLSP